MSAPAREPRAHTPQHVLFLNKNFYGTLKYLIDNIPPEKRCPFEESFLKVKTISDLLQLIAAYPTIVSRDELGTVRYSGKNEKLRGCVIYVASPKALDQTVHLEKYLRSQLGFGSLRALDDGLALA